MEKQKLAMEELRDEQRVRDQMKIMAIQEAYTKPYSNDKVQNMNQGGQTVYNQNMQSSQIDLINQMNLRKTAYAANQHSISIIGSDIGNVHLPNNVAVPTQQTVYDQKFVEDMSKPSDKIPRSPPQKQRPSPQKHQQFFDNHQEESLQGLLAL